MSRSRRAAFQMLELLVVVAIVLVLIGVSLPAIESARETAKRARCSQQLKQLAQAVFHYHDVHKTFPPGWMGPAGPRGAVAAFAANGQGNGPLPFLLPYLGKNDLFEKVEKRLSWDPTKPAGDLWFTQGFQATYNRAALEVAATPLSFLQCPSDTDSPLAADLDARDKERYGQKQFTIGGRTTTENKGGMPGNPGTSKAANPLAVRWGYSAPGEWAGDLFSHPYAPETNNYMPFGRVNYMPVAGLGGGKSPFYQQFEGVFTGRSDITLGAISAADGRSQTLMFGETTGQFYPTGGDNTMQVNIFSATGGPTARGLQQRCAPGVMRGWKPTFPTCDDLSFTTGPGQKARYGVFSSTHEAGVQFVFCDGSVRLIRRGRTWVLGSPDWYLLQQMAGYHDGFDRDVTSLLP